MTRVKPPVGFLRDFLQSPWFLVREKSRKRQLSHWDRTCLRPRPSTAVVEVLAKPLSDDSDAFAKRNKRRVELDEETYGDGHPDWIPHATAEEQGRL